MNLFKNKYSPKDLDSYIGDTQTLQYYIERSLKGQEADKAFLLFGKPGTGKSTIVNILADHFDVDLYLTNGSDDRNHINTAIIHSSSLLSDKKKLVVIDEADGLSKSAFKELGVVISNYSPIILIANDSNKIPGFIKSKCYQKQVIVDRFALKALAKRIIKDEGLNISNDQLNKDLASLTSYRAVLDYLQFGNTSETGSFSETEDLQSLITFTNDNSESPKMISLADIFFKRSQQGYKNGQKLSKYILDNIDKTGSDYPRTYRLLHEAKKGKHSNDKISIVGFR